MVEKKQDLERSKYTGITGGEIADFLNSKKTKSKEDSKKYVLSHVAFSAKRF